MRKYPELFERVVVLNLPHRHDRLKQFIAMTESESWPFRQPVVLRAVHGAKLPLPYNWIDGNGAYGAMLSHRRVLEEALIDDKKSLLVLEDDAVLAPDFADRLDTFFSLLPNDWECLMLGGQHTLPGKPVVSGVVRCIECTRFHAYGLRGPIIRQLYRHLISNTGHCDNISAAFLGNFKTYAPSPFLFEQSSGFSDVTLSEHQKRSWGSTVSTQAPLVVLRVAPQAFMHMAEKQNMVSTPMPEIGVDFLPHEISNEKDPLSRCVMLMQYIEALQTTAAIHPGDVATIHHPDITDNEIEAVSRYPVQFIRGNALTELDFLWEMATRDAKDAYVLRH